MRFFFIVMLWNKLFLTQSNNLNLLKFLNLVNHLGAIKVHFSSWCDDIPSDYMKIQVQKLVQTLQTEFSKLQPGLVP